MYSPELEPLAGNVLQNIILTLKQSQVEVASVEVHSLVDSLVEEVDFS